MKWSRGAVLAGRRRGAGRLPGVTDDGFGGMSEPYFGIRGHEVVIVG